MPCAVAAVRAATDESLANCSGIARAVTTLFVTTMSCQEYSGKYSREGHKITNFLRQKQFSFELAVKAREIRIAEPMASSLRGLEIADPAVPWQSEPLDWRVASALGGGRMRHIGAAGKPRALA